jgi:hypothetical protein
MERQKIRRRFDFVSLISLGHFKVLKLKQAESPEATFVLLCGINVVIDFKTYYYTFLHDSWCKFFQVAYTLITSLPCKEMSRREGIEHV